MRKLTGSYYTPPEVVTAMVRLVDEVLRDPARFGVAGGLASTDVTLADPAIGTGTYLLGVLRQIAETTRVDQGPGAVPGVIRAALKRVIGFELQFGPFAVAQLRLMAEIAQLLGVEGIVPDDVRPRLYVTDTLGNPYVEENYIPQMLRPLAESRRQANAVKRQEPITVVIGNPPYKEKAKGRGGWIEARTPKTETDRRERRDHYWTVGFHHPNGASGRTRSISGTSTSTSGAGRRGRCSATRRRRRRPPRTSAASCASSPWPGSLTGLASRQCARICAA